MTQFGVIVIGIGASLSNSIDGERHLVAEQTFHLANLRRFRERFERLTMLSPVDRTVDIFYDPAAVLLEAAKGGPGLTRDQAFATRRLRL
ncbi:hypothetical protein GR226_04265 [Rhizobium leguminosarum]|uniref:hypothetical protein n=1 Tax=Rhizobium ruizarguesonis TaxID=2081791 RepID=UPI0013DBA368|nr:hypothetical protein [Rhizobium ruizarguesonis]NEH82951.1 hypothetical protein [Rhizobium ruizarguesonis]